MTPEKRDYTVEKKEERVRMTRTGEMITVYRIWATSKGGTYFHIEVPEDQIGKADELLLKRARELDAI